MNEIEVIDKINIKDRIYEIRGKQVMLDSDLARLYHCDTGNLNRARKRNIKRFPPNFSFQITREEYKHLKCQNGISNIDLRTINRSLPFVYTEEGVAMLSSVLHTDTAVMMSIKIIEAFVIMRKSISVNMINNSNLINFVLEDHNRINRLEASFDKLVEKEKVNTIFFEGQIYDAYSLLIDILSIAKEEIIIIDNYSSKELLDIIKDIKVRIKIVSKEADEVLKKKYNKQYNNVEFINNNSFHDRFIIIDKKILYHCGASFKDIGTKCFAINKIEDKVYLDKILKRLS